MSAEQLGSGTRQLPASQYQARWKVLGGHEETERFRSICGKPGCPGSLGRLMEVRATVEGNNLSEHVDVLIEMYESQDRMLLEMQQRTPLPPTIADPAGRAAALTKAREQLAVVIAQVKGIRDLSVESQRQSDEILGILPIRGEIWAMHPERPHREPGTPKKRNPAPLYYGFPDTGFRISLKGNRARDGSRIARRPFLSRASDPAQERARQEFNSPYYPTGQLVCPPCRIWCPVCDSLNEVGLAPGFELVEAE